MKTNIRKNIELGVLFGLIFAVALSFARFDANCDELKNNILRLHIIANSDSAADQQLKLLVRDEILEYTSSVFEDCSDLDAAQQSASENIDVLTAVADSVIRQNGFSYDAKVEIADAYFDTREYEDFTLPAGTYRSLIVNLGAAEGKNWWCVVFPCVCVPSATKGELTDSVSEDAARVAKNASRYVMKFKTAEIYEDLKQYFKNKM